MSWDASIGSVDFEVRKADEPFADVPTATLPIQTSTGSCEWRTALSPGAYRWQARVSGSQAGPWQAFANGGVAFLISPPLASPPRRRPAPTRPDIEGHPQQPARAGTEYWTIGGARIPVRHCGSLDIECFHQWVQSLNSAERRFYEGYCTEENAYTPICGGTPLVVVFDGQAVEFTKPDRFVLGPDREVESPWPTSRTPWLARDLNGNGIVDDATELFGSFTRLPSGKPAANGFEALAALDENRDGTIDARDPAFASLLLWSDLNGDRLCTPDELVQASSVVESISLAFEDQPRCDERGNCERQRSAMRFNDGLGRARAGEVVDVWLRWVP